MTTKDVGTLQYSNATVLTRYVRVKRIIKNTFVEFDFAVGDPSLYVELVLPKAAFDEFCLHNNTVHMTDEQAQAVDRDMVKWRYGKGGRV